VDFLIILAFGLAAMYLLVILPQRRRQTAHDRKVAAIEVGDEIITSGGIYGIVRAIGNEDLTLEIAQGTSVRVSKRAVAVVQEPEREREPEPDAEPDAGRESPSEPGARG
jgi:preprotein translocase subunit YajC